MGQRFEQVIHKSRNLSAHKASEMILNVISDPVNEKLQAIYHFMIIRETKVKRLILPNVGMDMVQ